MLLSFEASEVYFTGPRITYFKYNKFLIYRLVLELATVTSLIADAESRQVGVLHNTAGPLWQLNAALRGLAQLT